MEKQGQTFAARLTAFRQASGLSMYALAGKSGVSKQALSRLEKGENEPSWETVQRLAMALGVDCRAFTDPTLSLPEQPSEDERPQRGRPKKEQPPAEEQPKKKGKRKDG